MEPDELLIYARHAAGLSQQDLARRAHTSRPTLSAYEHGRKSPTLATATRLLAESGFQLTLEPRLRFSEIVTARGRAISVPTGLPRLPAHQAFATVTLPVHLNWSAPGHAYDLRDRNQRARAYEIVIREGGPDDIASYIDGVLLIDLWDELVLPREIRAAWNEIINRTWHTAKSR